MQTLKPIANRWIPSMVKIMWSHGFFLVSALALSVGVHAALSADGPPPPKPVESGKPWQRAGSGARPFGMGGAGPIPGGQGMDGLSEEEKNRLRSAVEKVWTNPEVAAAREKIMKANEELRATLREALKKSDPEVVPILEKAKTPFGWDQHRGPLHVLRPDDPDFAAQASARLGFEMMSLAKPEQRDALRHLHERVVELPSVKEAIATMKAAPVGERMEAFKKVREVYKHECETAISEFRRKHAGEQGSLAAPGRPGQK